MSAEQDRARAAAFQAQQNLLRQQEQHRHHQRQQNELQEQLRRQHRQLQEQMARARLTQQENQRRNREFQERLWRDQQAREQRNRTLQNSGARTSTFTRRASRRGEQMGSGLLQETAPAPDPSQWSSPGSNRDRSFGRSLAKLLLIVALLGLMVFVFGTLHHVRR